LANQSIIRATRILNLFSYARPSWRGTDLAKAVNLPVTTVHGILQALEEQGFLEQDAETKEYRLGQTLNILGAVQRATLELNQKAAAPINYLTRETGLECRVGVFHQDMIVLTANTGHMSGAVGGNYIGPVSPAYCTALGRAILAHLSEDEVLDHLERVKLVAYTAKTLVDTGAILEELEATRQRGYALSLQEMILHMDTVGAALLGPGARPAGAICLVGSPAQVSGGNLTELAHAVMATASEISAYLGYQSAPVFR
jgi:DNA-binding IclR family transcriptional regulator